MKISHRIIATSALLGSLLSANAQEFFFNGDANGTVGGSIVPSGWIRISGSTDISSPSLRGDGAIPWSIVPTTASSNGGTFINVVDHVSFTLERAAQTVTGLTIGEQYTFSFEYAWTPDTGRDSFGRQDVTVSGMTGFVNPAGNIATPWEWQQYTGVLTATSTSATFTLAAFNSTGTGGTYIGYDGFSLTPYVPVPEPSTTLIGALGLLALLRRKR